MIRLWVKASLHLYYGKIKMHGLENIPKDAPVLFLPNHQNALLDVLLIAVDCNRMPYFLTRSDVFNGKVLHAFFGFLQMIPIYRMRDGRESLKNNQAVFDYCSELLMKKEAILMFPEANHNLKRRIRPLSKGFTRILFNTMDKGPDTEIQIVPVGINYRDAESFPDKVALFFGAPISVNVMYDTQDEKGSVNSIKEVVSSRLENLTTHIADEANYEEIAGQLNSLQVDYLKPQVVNKAISELQHTTLNSEVKRHEGTLKKLFRGVFFLLNFPMVLIWKKLIKPKVKEPEFIGTFRFGFVLLAYPIYYLILFVVMVFMMSAMNALITILILFLFNWMYVRLN